MKLLLPANIPSPRITDARVLQKNVKQLLNEKKFSKHVPTPSTLETKRPNISKLVDDSDEFESILKLKSDSSPIINYSQLLFDYISQKDETFPDTIDDWYKFLEIESKKFRLRVHRTVLEAKSDDFDYLKVLSKGSFASVVLSFKDNHFYAVKLRKKLRVERKKDALDAENEKKILRCLNCPFTISIYYYFESLFSYFYVLTLVCGKNLYEILNEGEYIPEYAARFYIPQIVLALEYLHNFHILYRNLKPENIIVDSDGYLKLIDFSLAKLVTNKTYTFCGAPEYMAPEVIENRGYDILVDWWSFGVLTYEICSGFTPFFSRQQDNIFKNILKCKIRYPNSFSNELKDLIGSLLKEDKAERFVTSFESIAHLKSHEWFEGVSWERIANRVVCVPYIPPQKENCSNLNKFDISYIEHGRSSRKKR